MFNPWKIWIYLTLTTVVILFILIVYVQEIFWTTQSCERKRNTNTDRTSTNSYLYFCGKIHWFPMNQKQWNSLNSKRFQMNKFILCYVILNNIHHQVAIIAISKRVQFSWSKWHRKSNKCKFKLFHSISTPSQPQIGWQSASDRRFQVYRPTNSAGKYLQRNTYQGNLRLSIDCQSTVFFLGWWTMQK